MIGKLALFSRALARCQHGGMAIETVFIAPILIALSIGGFEVSSIVARQTELQSAAAEAAAVVRASVPETAEERTTIRDIVMTSTDVEASQVSVVEVYRCGSSADYAVNLPTCATGSVLSKYIRVTISDTYQPMWTEFGFGSALDFGVTRTILVG